MEKELKIAELAMLWGVSVPAAWNRVRKEGLKTVKKLSENKKEITYVLISDEIFKKYVIAPVNNVNNVINNAFNEELLTDVNLVNNDNKPEMSDLTLSAREIFDRLTTLNNNYNEELKSINNELIEVKSKQLLLEDKAGREGLYLNEINTLKTDCKKLSNLNKLLITVIIMLIFVITIALTGFITVNNMEKSVINPVVEESVKKAPGYTGR